MKEHVLDDVLGRCRVVEHPPGDLEAKRRVVAVESFELFGICMSGHEVNRL
jgi:hypothetical protein